MKRFLSRFLCMLLCLSLAYSAVGCTKKEEKSSGDLIPSPAANSKYNGQLPIVDKPVTLKYTLSEGVASVTAAPSNDLPVLKE